MVGNNQLATGKESRIFGTLFLCVDKVKFLVSGSGERCQRSLAATYVAELYCRKKSHQIFFYLEPESYFYNIKPTKVMTPEESKKAFMEAKAAFIAFISAIKAEAQAFSVITTENISVRVCLN